MKILFEILSILALIYFVALFVRMTWIGVKNERVGAKLRKVLELLSANIDDLEINPNMSPDELKASEERMDARNKEIEGLHAEIDVEQAEIRQALNTVWSLGIQLKKR